jgi:hypothetical protein
VTVAHLDARRSAVGLASLALALAGTPGAQQATTRDSAGIRITSVSESSLAALPEWKVTGPVLAIGDVNGREEYEFDRASRPFRLSDGSIVVVNDRTVLRVYAADGTFLRTLSRTGSGPGEYRGIVGVARTAGDTLRVHDPTLRRLDVRGPHGEVVRSYPDVRATALWSGTGRGMYHANDVPGIDSRPGVIQRRALIVRVSPTGQLQDTIAVLPGVLANSRGGGNWVGVGLGSSTMFVAGAEHFAYAHGERLEVRWFDDSGVLRAISRIASERRRVTPAAIERWRQRQAETLAALRAANPQVRSEPGGRPVSAGDDAYAEFLPQISRLRIDFRDRVWIGRVDRFGEPSLDWVVLSTGGAPIARVRTPARFVPNDIGEDYLLGIATDEDGVQFVQMYALRR